VNETNQINANHPTSPSWAGMIGAKPWIEVVTQPSRRRLGSATSHPSSAVVLLLLAIVGFCFAGCSQNSADASLTPASASAKNTGPGHYPYTIVTTCGMVTDIVEQVAGDKATVTGLMGEGVDPHLYKPTRNDVKHMTDADVVMYSGLLLEGRISDTFAKIARSGKQVFAVTEGLDESYLREPPEFGGHYDPHVWMDVNAWSKCVGFIADSLAQYDPPNASFYRENSEKYRAELKKLDDYARKTIGTIPEKQRFLITAHDAFGYFSKAYNIPVRSVQGISTESEAGVDDINRLVDFIVENKVNAIFVETSVSEKNITAIIEGAKKRDWPVKIGGQLFSDAMGPAETYEGTYIGMIDHNVTVVTRALGGEAPKTGLNGKLKL
jgi:manganese/zinc/iron transport system substrate-binding protein